jgi:lipid-binding SYLF domain-containing protein
MSRLGVLTSMLVACLAANGWAEISTDEAKRLNEASTAVQDMRRAPDGGIPADLWNRADCVAVIPSLKKVAFVIGGEYGRGVLTCRNGASWGAPAFIELAKGSWGLQIGAQEIDFVLLVMNRRGIEKLLHDNVALGADASIAAGPVGRTAAADTDLQMKAEILSYSRAQGLFAGIDLSGGVLKADVDANIDAYGQGINTERILFGQLPGSLPAQALAFVDTLSRAVATSGRR